MTKTITTRQPEPKTVLTELERVKPYIVESLPSHVTPERFTRLALTTLRRTPRLLQTSPDSFVGALYTAAALGLEPDVNGECYLVPYGRETQLIVGYQGYAKLFWQHPLAARLSAEYVCENDEFSYDKGLNPHLHHKPALGNRGKIIAYYAIVGLTTGATWFDVYSPETIKQLRGGKVGPDPRFKGGDPEHWMERKTALRQIVKLAPKSAQLALSMQIDEQPIRDVEQARQIVTPDSEVQPAELETVDAEIVDQSAFPEQDDTETEWVNTATGEVKQA